MLSGNAKANHNLTDYQSEDYTVCVYLLKCMLSYVLLFLFIANFVDVFGYCVWLCGR